MDNFRQRYLISQTYNYWLTWKVNIQYKLENEVKCWMDETTIHCKSDILLFQLVCDESVSFCIRFVFVTLREKRQEVTSLALILNKAYLELQVLFEVSNDANLYPQLKWRHTNKRHCIHVYVSHFELSSNTNEFKWVLRKYFKQLIGYLYLW